MDKFLLQEFKNKKKDPSELILTRLHIEVQHETNHLILRYFSYLWRIELPYRIEIKSTS